MRITDEVKLFQFLFSFHTLYDNFLLKNLVPKMMKTNKNTFVDVKAVLKCRFNQIFTFYVFEDTNLTMHGDFCVNIHKQRFG